MQILTTCLAAPDSIFCTFDAFPADVVIFDELALDASWLCHQIRIVHISVSTYSSNFPNRVKLETLAPHHPNKFLLHYFDNNPQIY
jgi:hypothetical protein